MNTKKILIRKVKHSDLLEMKDFFIKAYGFDTIFKEGAFLNYYFGGIRRSNSSFSNSVIAITNNGIIVSYYGGLKYVIRIKNKLHPVVWGVNAYTLPEYRGLGINSEILKVVANRNVVNGVIGFTKQTAKFYEKIGYEVFNYEKFCRYIIALDFENVKVVSNYINQDIEKVKTIKTDFKKLCFPKCTKQVIELDSENIDSFNFSLYNNLPEILTTHRSKSFLKWRFFSNPFLNYKVYGVLKGKKIVAYIATREETLRPFDFKVNRIIDLFGELESIGSLLGHIIYEAKVNKCIYVDYSCFGSIYECLLLQFNFAKLDNDQCCVLPQVTSPLENRPNLEHLGILFKGNSSLLKSLNKDNVYFTRMDSDRDRATRLL